MKKIYLMVFVAFSIAISSCDNQAKQQEIEKQHQEDSISVAENVKKELAEKEAKEKAEREKQDTEKQREETKEKWETEDFQKNSSAFEKNLSQKAKQGDTEALKDLGMRFLMPSKLGSNLTQNMDLAISLLEKAATKDAEAQMFLAGIYLGHYGDGQYTDFQIGRKWLEKAAENGDEDAEFRIGYNYSVGADGYPQDYSEALKWRKRFAVKGSSPKHVEAQYNVGWQYLNGKGVEKDEFEAMKWFSMAAENGDADALRILRKYGMAR